MKANTHQYSQQANKQNEGKQKQNTTNPNL